MKRLLTLIAAAAVALMAFPAFAAVDGTPHDYLGTAHYGRCEICHVPHAAVVASKRLWRTAVGGGAADGSWQNSVVGKLCASCHNGGLSDSETNAAGTLPSAANGPTAYSATAHGRSWTKLVTAHAVGDQNLGDTQVATVNGKPYTSPASQPESGNMECTSCHNVHWDANSGAFAIANTARPFLRPGVTAMANAPMTSFCVDCHSNRLNNGTVSTSAGGNANHPVNITYTDNSNNGVGFFVTGVPAALRARITSATGWSLGGKFEKGVAESSSAYVGCATCHVVHNPANTAARYGVAANSYRGLYLLAIDNNTNAANTATFCEGCHGNPTGNTARASSGATMMVGTTTGDHPIDSANTTTDGGPAIDKWYTDNSAPAQERLPAAANTNWPFSNDGTNNRIICTSCHSAHRALTSAGNGFLKRAGGNASWCLSCHSDASPLGHHSHSGNSGSALTCESCHGSGTGDTGAHNGFSFNSGWNTVATNASSELCNMCHISVTTTGGPTPVQALRDPVIATTGTFGTPASFHLGGTAVNQALKSHYIGAFTNGAHDINAKTSNWATGAYVAFSKYGDAADTHGAVAATNVNKMICESCHAITKNIGARAGATAASGWQNNLLLQDYRDDTDNVAGSRAVKSDFCLACHNQGNLGNPAGPLALPAPTAAQAPAGIHPLTGFTITRAVDAGRTPTTLITANTGYAAAATAPTAAGGIGSGIGVNTSYPGTDQMDCDSCHRPHKANTLSTFTRTQTQPGSAIPVITEYWGSTANEYGEFCQACHAM